MPRAADPERTSREALLKLSEISIWLDGYDDVFSDFDPRPYQSRGLSDDFTQVASRAAAARPGDGLELKFLVPRQVRSKPVERLVAERIRAHFQGQALRTHFAIRGLRRRGLVLTLASVPLLLFGAWVQNADWPHFLRSLLSVLTTPAGWFMVFHGLDQVFYSPAKLKAEYEFACRMAECEISFAGY